MAFKIFPKSDPVFEQVDVKIETPSTVTPETAAFKKDLKPVKTKMRIKKTDVRQCRLCMRVLPREDVRETTTTGSDLRRKILDAVAVKITGSDKVKSVCINCLLVVDIINEFRMTCRKADTLHGTKLLMMHPGSWLSDENKRTMEACHRLVKRNRAEMDGLFKCSGIGVGDVHLLTEGKKEVLLDESENPKVKTEEMSDSDPEWNEQCAQVRQVENVSPRTAMEKDKIMCDICGSLVKKCNAEYHRNRHLGLKPYRCSEEGCKASFYAKRLVSIHVQTVHRRGPEQRYECALCHRMIKGMVGLRWHMKSQHSNKATHPLKTECGICGKMYYKLYIKDHMATHTGELPHGCEFCERRFAAKNNWWLHRKKYHQEALNAQQLTVTADS